MLEISAWITIQGNTCLIHIRKFGQTSIVPVCIGENQEKTFLSSPF